MQIRPSVGDHNTQLRIPGPSLRPGGDYWSRLERAAVEWTARIVRIDEAALAGTPSEDEAEVLGRSGA